MSCVHPKRKPEQRNLCVVVLLQYKIHVPKAIVWTNSWIKIWGLTPFCFLFHGGRYIFLQDPVFLLFHPFLGWFEWILWLSFQQLQSGCYSSCITICRFCLLMQSTTAKSLLYNGPLQNSSTFVFISIHAVYYMRAEYL